MNKKLLFIFIAAFLVRLIALNQSLWLDEATTARTVREMGAMGIMRDFSPKDFHPPLYYLFMKAWTNIFGYSEVVLRMPSVLFSLTAGYIVYLIGGIWASVFFLFNPLIIYYSQEARMYMMATFFLTTALYYLLRKKHILFGLFGVLGLLTFYGSIFLIIPMLLYLIYKKQFKFFLVSCFMFLVSLVIISPLLYQQLINARVSMSDVTNWSNVLGKANFKNLLLIPVKFSIGRIDFYPKWLYYTIAGGWTVFVFKKTVFPKDSLFIYLLIFPLFLGFIVSFFTPLLQYFRFLYLIPIMAILLALNSHTSMYRYIEVIGFVFFTLVYLLIPQFHREDWKSLVKSLPKDKPVYMIATSIDPLKYYDPSLKVNELKSLSSSSREIIVIPYAAEIYGLNYQKVLQNQGYQLSKKTSFRQLTLENWQKNQ